jgi:FkbM family methyltransferase
MFNLSRLLTALILRPQGDLVSLKLTERGRDLLAWCPDDAVFPLSRELVLDRVYESGGVALHAGMGTVLDAGAHVGIFSLQASQWADRVVALEAGPVMFGILALNVERNSLNNVDARHCALWSTSTECLKFSAAAHTAGGSVVKRAQGEGSGAGEVRAVSLDDLISELGHIDLLKIDIEGAEYEVLAACQNLASISNIVGEIHLEREGDNARRDVLVGQLERAGFSVSLISEAELVSRPRVKRLWRNRAALSGHRLLKALVACYYLAPIEKPIRPRGATFELPILVAQR